VPSGPGSVKLREVVTGFARIVVTTEGLSNGEGPDGCDVGVPQEHPVAVTVLIFLMF